MGAHSRTKAVRDVRELHIMFPDYLQGTPPLSLWDAILQPIGQVITFSRKGPT